MASRSSDSGIYFAGYLDRAGRGSFQAWKRWWAVLSGKTLKFYKTPACVEKGWNLASMDIGEVANVVPSGRVDLAMTVTMKSQTILLGTKNRDELDTWITMIRAAAGLRALPAPSPSSQTESSLSPKPQEPSTAQKKPAVRSTFNITPSRSNQTSDNKAPARRVYDQALSRQQFPLARQGVGVPQTSAGISQQGRYPGAGYSNGNPIFSTGSEASVNNLASPTLQAQPVRLGIGKPHSKTACMSPQHGVMSSLSSPMRVDQDNTKHPPVMTGTGYQGVKQEQSSPRGVGTPGHDPSPTFPQKAIYTAAPSIQGVHNSNTGNVASVPHSNEPTVTKQQSQPIRLGVGTPRSGAGSMVPQYGMKPAASEAGHEMSKQSQPVRLGVGTPRSGAGSFMSRFNPAAESKQPVSSIYSEVAKSTPNVRAPQLRSASPQNVVHSTAPISEYDCISPIKTSPQEVAQRAGMFKQPSKFSTQTPAADSSLKEAGQPFTGNQFIGKGSSPYPGESALRNVSPQYKQSDQEKTSNSRQNYQQPQVGNAQTAQAPNSRAEISVQPTISSFYDTAKPVSRHPPLVPSDSGFKQDPRTLQSKPTEEENLYETIQYPKRQVGKDARERGSSITSDDKEWRNSRGKSDLKRQFRVYGDEEIVPNTFAVDSLYDTVGSIIPSDSRPSSSGSSSVFGSDSGAEMKQGITREVKVQRSKGPNNASNDSPKKSVTKSIQLRPTSKHATPSQDNAPKSKRESGTSVLPKPRGEEYAVDKIRNFLLAHGVTLSNHPAVQRQLQARYPAQPNSGFPAIDRLKSFIMKCP